MHASENMHQNAGEEHVTRGKTLNPLSLRREKKEIKKKITPKHLCSLVQGLSSVTPRSFSEHLLSVYCVPDAHYSRCWGHDGELNEGPRPVGILF